MGWAVLLHNKETLNHQYIWDLIERYSSGSQPLYKLTETIKWIPRVGSKKFQLRPGAS
jgi:hypothetical protein